MANVNPADEFVETREDTALGIAEGDIYVRHRFDVGMHEFEVYVYHDEAGYFLDRKWFPFEREDFTSDSELISELVHHLSHRVASAKSA